MRGSIVPGDSLHFHALGMVRRFWIERDLDRMFSLKHSVPHADAVLAAVEARAAAASEAFQRARELRRSDEHGYVTHVQLIAEIAQRLVTTPELEVVGGFHRASGHVANWLQHNLALLMSYWTKFANFGPKSIHRILQVIVYSVTVNRISLKFLADLIS